MAAQVSDRHRVVKAREWWVNSGVGELVEIYFSCDFQVDELSIFPVIPFDSSDAK